MGNKTVQFLENVTTANPNYKPSDSVSWFNANVPKLFDAKRRIPVEIGKMYMFCYNPLYKNNLPYWDKYPLIIVCEIGKNTIKGLNLHYIEPKIRIEIVKGIAESTNGATLTKSTKITNIVKYLQKIKNYQYMVKQYSGDGVKSNVLNIPGEQWGLACALPLAKFMVGQGDQKKMGSISLNSLTHGKNETKEMIRWATANK